MIQMLIIYYFWGGGESGRFVVAFIFNYACYFSVIYRGGIRVYHRDRQRQDLYSE